MGMSEELARFTASTTYDDIPAYVIETQKKSILDAVGITLGAAVLGDGCKDFFDLAVENSADSKKEAVVLGMRTQLPASWAAFANAAHYSFVFNQP